MSKAKVIMQMHLKYNISHKHRSKRIDFDLRTNIIKQRETKCDLDLQGQMNLNHGKLMILCC